MNLINYGYMDSHKHNEAGKTMTLTFGEALAALERGRKVARAGWNGKNMWLIYILGREGVVAQAGSPYYEAGMTQPFTIDPHIGMLTVRGTIQPGWQPTQSDMLATDWHVV